MTEEEFGRVVMALRTYYPRENILPNEQAVELWFYQMQDIPYDVAALVLGRWAATNKWSPTIADIREQAAEVTAGKSKDWGDGWQQVLKAISRFGYVAEDQALDSMDELTRRVVQRLGFRNICQSTDIVADRANFRMIYETEQKRAKQDAQTPQKIKDMIALIERGKRDAIEQSS